MGFRWLRALVYAALALGGGYLCRQFHVVNAILASLLPARRLAS